MLHLILADSALERVPKAIWTHPTIYKRAKKEGKHPGDIFLDRTYHHKAMLKLKNNRKRGRPDIVHFSLLVALGTPLNKEGLLKVYVHTINDYIIYINPEVRLPKNYNRFIGLMEQLYKYRQLTREGPKLLSLKKATFHKLVEEVAPSYIIAFSRRGKPKFVQDVFKSLKMKKDLMVIVGAFPFGKLSQKILKIVDEIITIDFESLEAWIVVSRIISEYEKAIGLQIRRLKK